MFVIAGVTGRTGSIVASTLLNAGKQVRVIVREEAKGYAWSGKGAEVVVTDLDNLKGMNKALAGSEAAYLLLPPAPAAKDVVGRGRIITDVLTDALDKAKTQHVVFLSSLGAQHTNGTGPIKQLNYTERKFGTLRDTKYTFLRAAYFMENFASMLPAMKADGILPFFGGVETNKFPMIATADVGTTAANMLLEGTTTNQIVELFAATPYSMADAADAFAKALNKKVVATGFPLDAMVPALVKNGLGEDMAKLLREMNEAMTKGLVVAEGKGTRQMHGTITLEEIAKAIVSPSS